MQPGGGESCDDVGSTLSSVLECDGGIDAEASAGETGFPLFASPSTNPPTCCGTPVGPAGSPVAQAEVAAVVMLPPQNVDNMMIRRNIVSPGQLVHTEGA